MKSALNPQVENFAKALCNKHQGALSVIAELVEKSTDPSYYISGLFNLQITGWKIWVCYNDVCNKDIVLFQKKIGDCSILDDLTKTKDYTLYAAT